MDFRRTPFKFELMKQTFEDHCSKEGSIIFSSHQNPGIYVTEEINL